jgi:hypothetical protein
MSRPLPQSHEVRAAVTQQLLDNSQLLAMLQPNAPWNDQDGALSSQNSIVPMAEIDKMTPMYIGIMAGNLTRGSSVHFNGFMYIRVYGPADGDYIGIEQAAYQVARSLDNVRLAMANTVSVQVDFETMQPERVDEANNQKYRELQFKLMLL